VKKVTLSALMGLMVAGAFLAAATPSHALTAAVRVIPVKFVCGVQAPLRGVNPPAEPPVKPGNYATVINIESLSTPDPTGATATLSWNVSLAGAAGPTASQSLTLAQLQTSDITCGDIVKAVGPAGSFITGYVNIEPLNPPLAVTAVYTSQGCSLIGSPLTNLGPLCSGPVSIDVVPLGTFGAILSPTN
jgi:hypothetical protein